MRAHVCMNIRMCLSVCVFTCSYVYMSAGTFRDQSRMSHPFVTVTATVTRVIAAVTRVTVVSHHHRNWALKSGLCKNITPYWAKTPAPPREFFMQHGYQPCVNSSCCKYAFQICSFCFYSILPFDRDVLFWQNLVHSLSLWILCCMFFIPCSTDPASATSHIALGLSELSALPPIYRPPIALV